MSAPERPRGGDDANAAAGEHAPGRGDARGEPTGARGLLRDGLHLTVLSAFAIAQPLFSLLGDNAEFFAARDAPAIDIVLFALAATLLPPLALLLVELLAGLAGRRVRRAVHLLFVGTLAAIVAIQVLKRATSAPTATMVVATAAIGAGCAIAYARSSQLRSVLTVLSPAPLLFLAVFLCLSPVSALVLPSDEPAIAAARRTDTPVVWVVFDEFSGLDLLGPDGELDRVRYPNFARLAERSTWYRNATTVYDSTTQAVPALLSGRLPHKGELPTLRDHPGNLFTLLGRRGRTNAVEEATALCPDEICPPARSAGLVDRLHALGEDAGLIWLHEVAPPSLERELPSISESWGDFAAGSEGAEHDEHATEEAVTAAAGASAGGSPQAHAARRRPSILSNLGSGRAERLQRWIARIGPARDGALHFQHALLPHIPLLYLPSGAVYRRGAREPIPGQTSTQSFGDETLVDQAYQRHLLQVGFVDRQLGKLIDRLERTGLWDRALVVVTADHGVAFRRGEDRRIATRRNLTEVASVPLFVKAPGQRRGDASDVFIRSVDVLPTVAQLLRIRLPWTHDGRPAGSAQVRGRRSVTLSKRGFGGSVTLSASAFERRRMQLLRRQHALFGSGDEQPGLYGLGPNRELLGRALSELTVARGGAGFRAEIDGDAELRAVDRASGLIPAHVTATIAGDAAGARHDFAIAVNGRVEAVTRSVYLKDEPQQRLSAMVPETALRDGSNRVQVFEVERAGGAPRLTEVGAAGGRD